MKIQNNTHIKHGVTLVEFSVCILILAVLSAITIPLSINLREGSRRIKCSQQIKSIGFAILQYESEFGELPRPTNDATIEKILTDESYLEGFDGWVCPNCVQPATSYLASSTSYILNNSSRTMPPYFFGDYFESDPLTSDRASRQNGGANRLWMIRDSDNPTGKSEGSYDPNSSPGDGKAGTLSPHSKGRNYFFFDGHMEHIRVGDYPDVPEPDVINS